MPQAWKQYRSAPSPGTRVLEADALPEQGHLSLTLEGERGRFPLLVVCLGDGELRAYVNACPHQFLPLDQRGKRVLSEDGERLRFTNHDAAFSARTGEGTGGYGLGCALDPVPVRREDGWLVIGD
ncbi:Rieske 2Fe-2S domain-containing protein [Halomonas organivorans]